MAHIVPCVFACHNVTGLRFPGSDAAAHPGKLPQGQTKLPTFTCIKMRYKLWRKTFNGVLALMLFYCKPTIKLCTH